MHLSTWKRTPLLERKREQGNISAAFGRSPRQIQNFAACVFGWSDSNPVEVVHTCTTLYNILVRLRIGCELDDEVDEHGRTLRRLEGVEEFNCDVTRDVQDEESEGTTS